SLKTEEWRFPEGFKLGVATAAYQIEGGWNADGKGVSIWDTLSHNRSDLVKDGTNGDVACDSYNKWEEDVTMMKNLGVDCYRFSLAWTRIFPDGFGTKMNPAGVDHYNKLIDKLLENGIEPIITLFHWDLPQIFAPFGGWANPVIIDYFVNYAKTAFALFGDRVKTWITINEPRIICVNFKGLAGDVPSIYPSGTLEYMCGHNLLKAHAEVYHVYDREFRFKQKGKISLTLDFPWHEAANQSNLEDAQAAEQARQFQFSLYANPILNFDYPKVVKDRVAQRSKLEGFPESRLPKFSLAEKLRIRGTYDYLGINHYTTYYAQAIEEPPVTQTNMKNDIGIYEYFDPAWEATATKNFKVVPWGLRHLLQWVKKTYRGPEILITENGYAQGTEALDDDRRINYHRQYLNSTLQAIYQDGVNVRGYMVWSLMDNYEWKSGYTLSKSQEWKFPDDFQFGVSTSAYQIEGAWNESGKSVSVWDRITHQTPEFIADLSNGDIACDSYHKWKVDVDMLIELGVQSYRFSLAWTRILPGGYDSNVNQAGVDYYRNLIKELRTVGIQPVVTLYHWDMPQKISVLGGLANNAWETYFTNYARVAFELFGDIVDTWITFNEPNIICHYFNSVLGSMQPETYPNGVIEYLCSYNLLKAHAETYHIYDREFRHIQNGKVGITLNFEWSEPNSENQEDIDAADRRRQFDFGMFANPIINFDYPKVVIDRVAERSKLEGFPESRLKKFTLAEKLNIKGTYDFLGLNHYTTWLVANSEEPSLDQSGLYIDTKVSRTQDPSWEETAAPDNKVVPWGLRKALNWIKATYGNPDILITECGYSDNTGTLTDDRRINFYKGYLNATLQAILEDGVNVKAFMAWSLMDNFEWNQGYLPSRSDELTFPRDFKFGAATSAYQIEGGWNADGKGVSVWDSITHANPDFTADKTNGDVACDSYHKWEVDVEMLKNLSVDYYRFSLSWTRLLPDGFASEINAPGIQYYNRLIDKLIENGISPVVTLFHWDSPQMFSALGGFYSETFIESFTNYARVAFSTFGDRVKTWITFNEPKVVCQDYSEVMGAVNEVYPNGVIEYLCTHNLLRAHAAAYHMYNREFKPTQKGEVGITLNLEWSEPATDSPQDIAAAEQRRQFEFGLYANPIFHGNYPRVVIDRVADRSELEGFPQSRLPKFNWLEQIKIKGTYDFLGLNHYNSWMIQAAEEAPIGKPSYASDMGTSRDVDPSWESTEWIAKVVPWGLRRSLKWIKETYNNPKVIITECGYPDRTGTLEDDARINFFKKYLNATLQAIHEDNVKVQGFTAWSLMDNFEWGQGYLTIVAISNRTFPPNFKFGAATASYQIEGVWNEDGKGVNFGIACVTQNLISSITTPVVM
ncbi:myrosinase 1-like, partial [Asbolus verrucosus]